MFRTTPSLARHIRPTTSLSRTTATPCTTTTYRSLKHTQQRILPVVTWQATRSASSGSSHINPPSPNSKIDLEAERKLAQETLKSDPSSVSSESTTRKGWESTKSTDGGEEDMSKGLKHDVNIIKDTFQLSSMPYEARLFGLAGTVPYFATSLSTLYLGWDLTKTLPTGNALYDTLFINHESAQHLLSIIEPIQLTYGAVIISFLGAIHWGLEFAETKPLPERTRFRYAMGVAASVIAWPTVMMPIEYGLTSQFMAFTALYFADSSAATRGWAPRWYAQYRFMLTAVVGLAIFVSLIGRSQLEKSERLSEEYLRTRPNKSALADKETDWAKVEAEEIKRKKKEERKAKERKEKEEKEKKSKEKDQSSGSEGGETKNTDKADEGQEKGDEEEKGDKEEN